MMENAKICLVDGCLNQKVAKGYCKKHYNSIISSPPKICSLENCENRRYRDNLCSVHYSLSKKCAIESCKGKYHAGGYCSKHYNMSRIHGDPLYMSRNRTKKCIVKDCEKKVVSKGYCTLHSRRFKIHGNPLYENRLNIKGIRKHPLYSIYRGIKRRCYCTTEIAYASYGAKGIKMNERWLGLNGFLNFAHDMGERPSLKHSVDRIDNNKGYSPENCRWATQKEQCNNKNNNVLLTFNGITKNIQQWSEYTNIPRTAINHRIRNGWNIDKTLTTPVIKRTIIEYNGESKRLSYWCKKYNINIEVARYHLKKGEKFEKIFINKD